MLLYPGWIRTAGSCPGGAPCGGVSSQRRAPACTCVTLWVNDTQKPEKDTDPNTKNGFADMPSLPPPLESEADAAPKVTLRVRQRTISGFHAAPSASPAFLNVSGKLALLSDCFSQLASQAANLFVL